MSLVESQRLIMGFSRMYKKKKKDPLLFPTHRFLVRRTLCNVRSRAHTPSVLSPGWFWHGNTKPNDKSYQQRKLSPGSKVIDISGIPPRLSDRGSVCLERRNEPPCSIAGYKTRPHQQHAGKREIDLYSGAPFNRPARQISKFTPWLDLTSPGLKPGGRRGSDVQIPMSDLVRFPSRRLRVHN